jgi:hypothetical protein
VEAVAQRLLDNGGMHCDPMNSSLLARCYMVLPKLLLFLGDVPPEQRSLAVRAAIDWIVHELEDHEVDIYLPGNNKAWQAIRK